MTAQDTARLNARYALITGSTSKVGSTISTTLAELGYNLILHCNSSLEKATSLKQNLEKTFKIKAEILQCNLLQNTEDFISATFNSISNRSPKECNLQLVVNNACTFNRSSIRNISTAQINEDFCLNVTVPTLISVTFFQYLELQQRTAQDAIFQDTKSQCNLINITDSMIFCNSISQYLSYSLSKKTLAEATKVMSQSFSGLARVNAIAIGRLQHDTQATEPSTHPATTYARDIKNTIGYICNTPSLNGNIIVLDNGEHLR